MKEKQALLSITLCMAFVLLIPNLQAQAASDPVDARITALEERLGRFEERLGRFENGLKIIADNANESIQNSTRLREGMRDHIGKLQNGFGEAKNSILALQKLEIGRRLDSIEEKLTPKGTETLARREKPNQRRGASLTTLRLKEFRGTNSSQRQPLQDYRDRSKKRMQKRKKAIKERRRLVLSRNRESKQADSTYAQSYPYKKTTGLTRTVRIGSARTLKRYYVVRTADIIDWSGSAKEGGFYTKVDTEAFKKFLRP